MPATFFPPSSNIVRPFDFRLQAGDPVLNRAAQRRGRRHGQLRRFLRPKIRSQQNGKPKSPARGGNPFAAQPSATARLGFGKHDGAFLHAVARELFNHIVRRSCLLKHVDVAADDVGFAEAREQIVGEQRVRFAPRAGSRNAGRPRSRSRRERNSSMRAQTAARLMPSCSASSAPDTPSGFSRKAERILASVVMLI